MHKKHGLFFGSNGFFLGSELEALQCEMGLLDKNWNLKYEELLGGNEELRVSMEKQQADHQTSLELMKEAAAMKMIQATSNGQFEYDSMVNDKNMTLQNMDGTIAGLRADLETQKNQFGKERSFLNAENLELVEKLKSFESQLNEVRCSHENAFNERETEHRTRVKISIGNSLGRARKGGSQEPDIGRVWQKIRAKRRDHQKHD